MVITVSDWGNSKGLRLPKAILQELKIMAGDKMRVLVENQKIVLEPIKYKYNIRDLVKNMAEKYDASEVFDDKQGIEEW
jgi:antitoxin MazE